MSSITSINYEVFQYTGNGQRVPRDVVCVWFHRSVVKVEDRAFSKCKSLKKVVFNEGLIEIGSNAFYNCNSLESITLPSTVTSVGEEAFNKCVNLKEVVLNDGLKKIDERAFKECISLERISIPSTVKIGNYVFSCYKLKEVVLNEGVKRIGKSFYKCKALESINLPSTLMEIGNDAFYSCSNLRQVVLNEGLKEIGQFAFSNSKLDSINLPSTLVKIGKNAFRGCTHLGEVLCSEGLPDIWSTALKDCPTLGRFTFPSITSRLDDIIQAGQVNIQNKIQQCINRGDIDRCERRGTIYVCADTVARRFLRRRGDWWYLVKVIKEQLHQIVNWIKYYEMKEATSLFELALWKTKMDQVDNICESDRDTCRIDVPGPVKDSILQYYGVDIP